MTARPPLTGVQRVPALPALLRWRYERRFRTARGAGALSGVYRSRDAAAQAVPADATCGYDAPAAGQLYRDLLADAQAKDYPALFWLREAVAEARTVFDLGGHVGVSYYAFRRYLQYPPALRWVVCDVPAVARAGEAMAREREEPSLSFTTDPRDANGADVLLASGSLQYIAPTLDELLAGLAERPPCVIVNQMPTHPERTFFTLQNIGVAFCPYRVAAIDALPRALAALGYELRDRWDDPSRRTAVPHEPTGSPIAYTGYCFRRR